MQQITSKYPFIIDCQIPVETMIQTRQVVLEKPVKTKQKSQQLKPIKKQSRSSEINKGSSKKKRKIKKNKKKDTNFSGKSQKDNRNYTSIISRMFLLHIANHPDVDRLLKPVIQHFKIMMSRQIFLKTFNDLFDPNKNYIRKQLVQSVCNSQICNKQFSLIFRVLFSKFIKSQIFPTVFRSNKLNKKVKLKEAKFSRKVYETFFEASKRSVTEQISPISNNKKSVLHKETTILESQNGNQASFVQNSNNIDQNIMIST